MAYELSSETKNALLNSIRARIDGAAGPGKLLLLNAAPASPDSSVVGGTIVCEVPLVKPCAPPPVGGLLEFTLPPPAEITTDSSVVAARLVSGSDIPILDLDVTTDPDATNSLVLSSLDFVDGFHFTLNSLTLSY